MRRIFFALLALTTLVPTPPARAEAPRVVATIAPLHSLVAGVMRGVGEPRLLVPGTLSEHGYAMRPSDASALNAAQLVVLVGGGLERFLEKPLAALGDRARIVEWMALPGIQRLPMRDGDNEEDHGHAHDRADDPHLWLAPPNAVVLVSRLAQELTALDPANATTYAANAEALRARLAALDADLAERLRPVGQVPFLVFHDGYQYFEKRYHLAGVGAVAIAPERSPGPRRLAALNARIRQHAVRCIFREPQFPPKLVQTLTERADARVGILDGLGAGLAPGPDLYFQTLDAMARSLTNCLS